MSILRAQSIFPYHTGIPRDVITNTVHFDWDEAGTFAAAATEIGVRMDAFFTSAYTGTSGAANYVRWDLATIEVINLADPSPRIPEVRSMPIAASVANTEVPTEVAAVMTYAAADTGGVVRQRLYNRIYLGGLSDTAMSPSSASTFPTLSVFRRDAIALAAEALFQENDGALDWIQYSPTSGVARPIARGWVDNSPDTQRRRSVDDTSRTPINFVP